MFLLIPLIVGCQPTNNGNVASELAAIKKKLTDLKTQVADINSEIELTKENVAQENRRRFKTLPDQNNFNANGLIPSLGDNSAQIVIVEFSDYQCPYCKRFTDNTFTKIKENYVDSRKVRYLTRDFHWDTTLKLRAQQLPLIVASSKMNIGLCDMHCLRM